MTHDDLWDDVGDDAPEGEGKAASEPTATHAVRRDVYDARHWEHLVGNNQDLRMRVADLELLYPTSRAAYEDLFHMLFTYLPEFEEARDMVDIYRPQHSLMTQLWPTEALQFERKLSTHDEYFSLKALENMHEPLRQAFEDMQRALEEQPDPAEGQEPGTCVGCGETPDTIPSEVCQAGQPHSFVQDPTEAPSQVVAAMAQAVRKATTEAEEEEALMEAYGVGPGTLQRMPFEERRRLADKLASKEKLKNLAKRVGAFRVFAGAEMRKKVVHAPGEFVGYTEGDDLMALAPEELVNMLVPELEELFWIRRARGELRVEMTQGVERGGRGPIIVVCDESQSMSNELDAEGTREEWSKAFALAMSDQAAHDHRDFVYIGFGNKDQVWSTTFPQGRGTIDQVVDFACHFWNGGTHFERPLREAMDLVGTYGRAGKPKPDILFITDGECSAPPEFVAEWRAMRVAADVRCYGVQIGGTVTSTMRALTDRVISISRLNSSPAGMAEVFRTV